MIARGASGLFPRGRRLAFDRMDVDGAQTSHPQHIHFERAVDPVAIERADQIVYAVDLHAIETDHDIAGQKPGPGRRPVRFDLRQQRAHLVVDAGDNRMPPRNRRGLAGNTDIGAPLIMAVLMPITSAADDTSGPPELPGLSAASV